MSAKIWWGYPLFQIMSLADTAGGIILLDVTECICSQYLCIHKTELSIEWKSKILDKFT